MERRTFLRSAGLAIAMPAAVALPTVAAAMPAASSAAAAAKQMTALERAAHHLAEFAKAMDEAAMPSGAVGWALGGGHMIERGPKLPAGNWGSAGLIFYDASEDPRFPKMKVERHVNLPTLVI